MAWTTAQDVLDAWIGDGAPTDPVKVDTWIGMAERLIRREVPDLQARIDAEAELVPPSTDLLDSVRDIVIAMVTRVFKNPDGKRSMQSASGPLSESITFGGDNPGGLFLSDDERRALLGRRTGQRAFMVDMIPSCSPYSPHNTSGGFYPPGWWV